MSWDVSLLCNFEDYPLNNIENRKYFIYPGIFFVEHSLSVFFKLYYIKLQENGLVRKGFMMKCQVEWIKKNPDLKWGFNDYENQISFTSFLFYFYFEYSNFINDIFYFSFGFHYKGGINLYETKLITIDRGIIGVPFDSVMKVHGLNYNRILASHVILLNSLFGFKTSNLFHIGFYFDMTLLFEKEPETYLTNVYGKYYNNIILGYGCFLKWNPYKLLILILEISFSHEIGENVIRGPVIGFYIQKSFIDPKIKKEYFKKVPKL